jgi:CheY-like chemotaxis protein
MNRGLPSLLVVEDDPNDVMFILRGLKQAGVGDHVQVARDGGEAVAYLEGKGAYHDRTLHPLPALMTLDLKLPRTSGLEVLKRIRNDPRFKDLPVVILTSSKEPGDIERARELGISAYHVKPVEFKEFNALIRSIGHIWMELTKQTGVPGGA